MTYTGGSLRPPFNPPPLVNKIIETEIRYYPIIFYPLIFEPCLCILFNTPYHVAFRPSTITLRLMYGPPMYFDTWSLFCNSWVSLNAIDLKCLKEGENDLSLELIGNVVEGEAT